MPYVHLANGDVEKVTQKDLDGNYEQSGSHTVFRKDGMEHHIVGVYPEEYEHPETEEVRAEKEKQNDADRAEFEAWKARRNERNNVAHDAGHDPNSPEVDWSVGQRENE